MSSSEGEDDFYTSAVKKLAKFNDVESNDESDIEDNTKVISSVMAVHDFEDKDESNIEGDIKLTTSSPKVKTRGQKNRLKSSSTKVISSVMAVHDFEDEDESDIEDDALLTTPSPEVKTRGRKTRRKSSSVMVVNDVEDEDDIIFRPRRSQRSRSKKTKSPPKIVLPSNQRVTRQRIATALNKLLNKNLPAKKKTRQPQRRRINVATSVNSSLIVLSDSDECQANTEKAVSDVNFEYKIKIWWQFRELKDFKIRKYQKISTIFDYYSEREQLPINRLLFLINNKTIRPDDTPDSLNLESIQIIEGGFLNEDSSVDVQSRTTIQCNESSMIQLKVQLRDRKKPLIVAIKKTEPLSILMAKCSEELQSDMKNLKFLFDGDLLNPNDTPESLDFDGGECIDVFVK